MAEQAEVHPHNAVDTEVDHRRAHQRRHRAGRLGVGAGQPGVQWQQSSLRTEPGDREHEHRVAEAVRQCPGAGERVGAGRCRRQHEPDQDQQEAELGHHGVKQCGGADFGAMMLGEHQDQRCHGHQFPAVEQRADGAGRRDQQHRGHEQRQDRQRHGAQMLAAGVADGVDTDRHGDGAGERHEEAAERIRGELHAGQWQQPVDAYRLEVAEDGQQPGPHPERADNGRRHAGGHAAAGAVPVAGHRG